jgi:hypothetical protein
MIKKLAVVLGLTLLPVAAAASPAVAKGGNCTTQSTQRIAVSALPHTFSADGAGTVRVDKATNARLQVVKVTRNAGWSSETERALARQVEVSFHKGGKQVKFSAERESGSVRARVQICS